MPMNLEFNTLMRTILNHVKDRKALQVKYEAQLTGKELMPSPVDTTMHRYARSQMPRFRTVSGVTTTRVFVSAEAASLTPPPPQLVDCPPFRQSYVFALIIAFDTTGLEAMVLPSTYLRLRLDHRFRHDGARSYGFTLYIPGKPSP